MKAKKLNRIVRHKRIRKSVMGTSSKPRISVSRSNQHLFVQVIDDSSNKTIASVGDLGKKLSLKGNKKEKAEKMGASLAEKIKSLGINEAVFDRGGFKYHGRIQALADALRKNGIKI